MASPVREQHPPEPVALHLRHVPDEACSESFEVATGTALALLVVEPLALEQKGHAMKVQPCGRNMARSPAITRFRATRIGQILDHELIFHISTERLFARGLHDNPPRCALPRYKLSNPSTLSGNALVRPRQSRRRDAPHCARTGFAHRMER